MTEAQDKLSRTFIYNVRCRMRLLEISQVELARRMGVTTPRVNHLLTGLRKPGLDTLANLAEALEIPPDSLIREQEKRSVRT